jgi:hypothetical protein
MMLLRPFVLTVMLALSAGPISAQSPDEAALEQAVVELRQAQQDVAAAAGRVDALREQLRQGAAGQTAWLAQLRLQHQALAGELAALGVAADVEQTEGSAAPLSDPHEWLFRELADRTRAWVDESLAYRHDERMARVQTIETAVDDGSTSALAGVSRLWDFLMDEHRLGASFQLDRTAIRIDDQTQLADVARLGMVVLYVRLADGRTGYVLPSMGNRAFVLPEDSAEDLAVHALFERLLTAAVPDVALPAVWAMERP